MRTVNNLKLSILGLLLLLCHFGVFSQHNDLRIKYYTLEDGLSQVSINCLLQDKYGFIWIGTGDGLNRFDGSKFKIFKHDKQDVTTISGNNISSIQEDGNGNIWVGTLNSGLNYYNHQDDEFKRVRLNHSGIENESISDLLFENDSTLWVASQTSGLHRIQISDDKNLVQNNYLPNQPISALVSDNHNALWVGDVNGQIYKIQFRNDRLHKEKLGIVVDGHIRALYKTEKQLLIGSTRGLYIYDLPNKQLEKIGLEDSVVTFNKTVNAFHKESDSTVWIGTQDGLYLFDLKNKKVLKKLEQSDSEIRGLSNDAIMSLLKLSDNELFVGTSTYLNLLDFNTPHFKNLSKDKLGRHLLNDNVVFSVLQDEKDLWIGTSDGGLNLIRKNKSYYFREQVNKLDGISGSRIRAMVMDDENERLWLASSGGLNMINLKTFDPDKPKFKTFKHNPNDANTINTNLIKDVALDANNNVWGATYGHGIFRLHLSNNLEPTVTRFIHNGEDENSLIDDYVHRIQVDKENEVWIGTQGGLSKLNLGDATNANPTFTNYWHQPNNVNSLSDNEILDILIDYQERIWLATRYGLNQYLEHDKFKRWTEQDQFPNTVIWSLQDDTYGNLWLGTSAGIIKYDVGIKSFTNYGLEDGIQGSEFNAHAKFRNSDGTIYLGGIDGMTYFHPSDLEGIDKAQPLYFSKLRVKNQTVYRPEQLNGILTKGILATTELEFKYDQFPFYLQFSSIDFRLNKKVDYGYKLLSTDEEWNMLNDSEIQFLSLPAGNHTLLVNGFSRGKVWDQAPLKMNLTILPPWWSTTWAYVIYLAIAAALGYYFYRFKLSRKLAVAESMRLKEVSALKSGLYTNITHEIRTPLTVILGMTQNLKKNLKNSISVADENSLTMIERNGENLLEMVNEMLDLAKIESNSMELNLMQTDVIPFVKYLSESFHSLAETKKINLTVHSEVDALEMDVDVNKMASIISNLLSNAIKFTADTGKIVVNLNKIELEEAEFLVITVQDNGLGLAEEDIAHLFDRFYQVNSTSTKQEGTGIGLSLTREFVKLMKATISVESTLGKGSTFTVQIPITNSSTKTDEAKITVAPSIKALVPVLKIEALFEEDASELPLVLIIEDNLDVAHYIKTCLIENYRILHASNGAIGIDVALEKIPDIIISDVMMPEKDGFEVCETLKTDDLTDHIPIIVLTAKATFEDRLAGLSLGADAYLTKPFEKAELLTRIDQLILLRKKMLSKFEKTGIERLLNKNVKNSETKFLNKIIRVIHDNITQTEFGPDQLAIQLHLSESQLYRKLKATSGKSTALFIRSIRLQKAKGLIQTTDKTISEIAYDVGFNDPSYFSRAFKEAFGNSPSTFSK